MHNFKSEKKYLKALKKKPQLAIVPINLAASVLNKDPRTIKNWIRENKIGAIKIVNDVFVLASELQDRIDARNKLVLEVKKELVKLLKGGKTDIYYAEIMDKFGYSYMNPQNRDYFGWVLGDVSRIARKEMKKAGVKKSERGLLSSMVWRKDLKTVSDGYWYLVEHSGLKVPSDKNKHKFVLKQIDKCINFYVPTGG